MKMNIRLSISIETSDDLDWDNFDTEAFKEAMINGDIDVEVRDFSVIDEDDGEIVDRDDFVEAINDYLSNPKEVEA